MQDCCLVARAEGWLEVGVEDATGCFEGERGRDLLHRCLA